MELEGLEPSIPAKGHIFRMRLPTLTKAGAPTVV